MHVSTGNGIVEHCHRSMKMIVYQKEMVYSGNIFNMTQKDVFSQSNQQAELTYMKFAEGVQYKASTKSQNMEYNLQGEGLRVKAL